jgi:tetratricopeptide (TPR) repeat protein
MNEMIEQLKQALAEVRESGNQSAEAKILHELGTAYLEAGQPEQAVQGLTEAAKAAYTQGTRGLVSQILASMGRAYNALGQEDRAADCFERAANIGRELSIPAVVATSLSGLGEIAAGQGKIEGASEQYEQALEFAQASGDKLIQARLLNTLGKLYLADRRVSRSNRYYHMAFEAAQGLNNPRIEATALYGLGLTALDLKRPDEAATHLKQAFTEAHKAGDPALEQEVVDALLTAFEALGEIDRIIEVHEYRAGLAGEAGNLEGEFAARRGLADVLLKMDKMDGALENLERARVIAQELEDREAELSLLGPIADAYDRAGFEYMVLNIYDDWVNLAREARDRDMEMTALEALAETCQKRGETAKAIEALKGALTIAQVKVNYALEGRYHHRLGQVYLASGDRDSARQELERALAVLKRADDQSELRQVEDMLDRL